MAVLAYRIDNKGIAQPYVDHDPDRHILSGPGSAVYVVNLPPESCGTSSDHPGCAISAAAGAP